VYYYSFCGGWQLFHAVVVRAELKWEDKDWKRTDGVIGGLGREDRDIKNLNFYY
jgi:hypothetical protein